MMKTYPSNIQHALDKCQAYTRKYNNEYGIALREGTTVFEKEGYHNEINFNAENNILMQNTDTFVHSHPVPSSLSIADIIAGNHFNVAVYAITPRGDVFWFNHCTNILGIVDLHNKGYDIFQSMTFPFEIPRGTPISALSFHYYLKKARDMHLIDYQFVLSAQTNQEIIEVETQIQTYIDTHNCRY